MITVLISAPASVVRAGLEAIVNEAAGLTVAGTAAGPAALASSIDTLRPDVILLDPGARTEDITALLSHTPPVVLLADDSEIAYLKAGARAVLPHSSTGPEIAAAIVAVAAGLVVMHPASLTSSPPDNTLSARETEVLRMLAEGAANKLIAYRLGVSEHTVKFHVASLFAKLHVSSRTEAVTAGIRQGLIML